MSPTPTPAARCLRTALSRLLRGFTITQLSSPQTSRCVKILHLKGMSGVTLTSPFSSHPEADLHPPRHLL